MLKVVLRADADASIGAGHLMRCLSLARALRSRAEPVIATTCRSRELLAHVERAGIPIATLDAERPDVRDAAEVGALFTAPGAVVVDGYHFDTEYVAALRAMGHRTLIIDDRPRLPEYGSDLLLDQNLGALRQPYQLAAHTAPLLGPRFTLVPPVSADSRPAAVTAPPVATRLLVTMGASDPANATDLVLRALERIPDLFDVTVVVGGANPHLKSIRATCAGRPRMTMVHNAAGLTVLMADADLAVAAVGGTIWELARIGVPALLLSGAEVQHTVGRVADRYGAHRWLGAMESTDEATVADALAQLASDAPARAEMRRLGLMLVDGGGADRVAAALVANESTQFRPAVATDAEAIWEMTCAIAELGRPVFGQFERSFNRALNSDQSLQWVADQYGSITAFARYDHTAGDTAVTVGAAAARRTAGPASRLLCHAHKAATAHFRAARVHSLVAEGDVKSRAILVGAGFTEGGRAMVDGRQSVVFERA